MRTRTVYFGLGSNLGDRLQNLQTAVDRLNAADLRISRISSIYETAPVDYLNQRDFLNCVVEAETTLMPMQLLFRINSIERGMGRKRQIPKGPRNIDIDILLHGPSVVQTNKLQIPHPGIALRRFVLEPLAELSPELVHPVLRRKIADLLTAAPRQFLVRFVGSLRLPASS